MARAAIIWRLPPFTSASGVWAGMTQRLKHPGAAYGVASTQQSHLRIFSHMAAQNSHSNISKKQEPHHCFWLSLRTHTAALERWHKSHDFSSPERNVQELYGHALTPPQLLSNSYPHLRIHGFNKTAQEKARVRINLWVVKPKTEWCMVAKGVYIRFQHKLHDVWSIDNRWVSISAST